eukprot:15431497-Alexandrium_andersonii.AAC.1
MWSGPGPGQWAGVVGGPNNRDRLAGRAVRGNDGLRPTSIVSGDNPAGRELAHPAVGAAAPDVVAPGRLVGVELGRQSRGPDGRHDSPCADDRSFRSVAPQGVGKASVPP